jgi:hypothetical protein
MVPARDAGSGIAGGQAPDVSDLEWLKSPCVLLAPLPALGYCMLVAANTGKLRPDCQPCEVFPSPRVLEGSTALRATPADLASAGLAGMFEPDPDAFIRAYPLPDSMEPPAVLLVLSSRECENITDLIESRMHDLRIFLSHVQTAVRDYELGILTRLYNRRWPCVIVDGGNRIMAANGGFFDIVGQPDRVAGCSLREMIHLESDLREEFPPGTDSVAFTTPLFVRPRGWFCNSEVEVTRFETVCGDRLAYSFKDIIPGSSSSASIILIQRLSGLAMAGIHTQATLRRLVNAITAALTCDLVCILLRKGEDGMIVTPYSNRRLDMLRANFIEASTEPVLGPFIRHRNPVFCDDIAAACRPESFFRQVMPIESFALLPAGGGSEADYALLIGWTSKSSATGCKSLPVLRIIANLVGSVLRSSKLTLEIQCERDALRRYTSLTADREVQMARLKKENARLTETLKALTGPAKEPS